MAELDLDIVDAASCCSPQAHQTCCAAEAKTDCCADGCGCADGAIIADADDRASTPPRIPVLSGRGGAVRGFSAASWRALLYNTGGRCSPGFAKTH